MSVSKWAWTEECDNERCCGDCDLCSHRPEQEEEAMTREEAISVLNGLRIPCAVTVDGYSCERNKAIDMAIEALSEPSDKTETGFIYPFGVDMDEPSLKAIKKQIDEHWYLDKSDLISRADVHKTLNLLATEGGADAKMLLMDAHEFIDALPSADRPNIVMCKDCKHRVFTKDGESNPHDIVCDFHMSDGFDETDFCSNGKRREP